MIVVSMASRRKPPAKTPVVETPVFPKRSKPVTLPKPVQHVAPINRFDEEDDLPNPSIYAIPEDPETPVYSFATDPDEEEDLDDLAYDGDSVDAKGQSLASQLTGSPIKKRRKFLFLQALEASMGNITVACRATRRSRTAYDNWMATDPAFKAAATMTLEVGIDYVEQQLFKKIKAGDTTAMIFYLKTIGRRRGYVERVQFAGHNDGPVMIGGTLKLDGANPASPEQLEDLARDLLRVSAGDVVD